jgi:MoxR-like ATPase
MLETPDGGRQFQFQPGPIFANVLLADEINRATPKTQSALLEAMQEHSVTVAGVSHPLPGLFFVMATQNPLEMEGTYPLPEAQLDRFFCKLLVPFPTTAQMEAILDRTTETQSPRAEAILDGDQLVAMGKLARRIPIADSIRRYGISLVMATHPEQPDAPEITRRYIRYGASPRGAQSLILAAKIHAILDHRYHVATEDLQAVVHHVLRHRLILNFEGQAEGIQTDQVLDEIVRQQAVV